MTDLRRIDLAKFKTACEYARSNFAALSPADFVIIERGGHTRRSWFKNMIDADDFRLPAPIRIKSVDEQCDELRTQLRVAAGTAMQYGATADQIDHIVALAEDSGNFNVMSGGRLTRADARQIIRSMEEDR